MSARCRPGGGLVQDVEGAAGGPFAQFPGEFQALGLAAGQGGGRLPQLHVAQAHVRQGLQAGFEGRHRPEDLQGLVHGEIQDLGDGVPFVADLQGAGVVAQAPADLAASRRHRAESASRSC